MDKIINMIECHIKLYFMLQNKMIEKLNDLKPKERTDEVANIIFKEMLGYRSGYTKGLSGFVIPKPTSSKMLAQVEHLVHKNDRHKNLATQYKIELDEPKMNVQLLMV